MFLLYYHSSFAFTTVSNIMYLFLDLSWTLNTGWPSTTSSKEG